MHKLNVDVIKNRTIFLLFCFVCDLLSIQLLYFVSRMKYRLQLKDDLFNQYSIEFSRNVIRDFKNVVHIELITHEPLDGAWKMRIWLNAINKAVH